MKSIENIKNLELMEKARNDNTGFFSRKTQLKLKINHREVIVSQYCHTRLERFAMEAIKEREQEIIDRALELESIEYEKVKELAKIEAAELLLDKQFGKPKI